MWVQEYVLPTHWASAFINGDLTGYEHDDLEAIRLFTAQMVKEYGCCWCINVEDDMGFLTYHNARDYGVLACECSTFTFDVFTADERIDA